MTVVSVCSESTHSYPQGQTADPTPATFKTAATAINTNGLGITKSAHDRADRVIAENKDKTDRAGHKITQRICSCCIRCLHPGHDRILQYDTKHCQDNDTDKSKGNECSDKWSDPFFLAGSDKLRDDDDLQRTGKAHDQKCDQMGHIAADGNCRKASASYDAWPTMIISAML